MTVPMPSPGRSRASSRSSSSGSPKCMYRPPLQVPTAVWVRSGTADTVPGASFAFSLVRLPLAGLAGGSGVGIAGLLLVLVGLFLGLVVVAVLAIAGCALHGRR